MFHSLRHRFDTIRWKLAGSYVLVALLIALIGELVLLAMLVYFFNSRLLLDSFQTRAHSYSLALRVEYLADTGREAKLAARMRDLLLRENQQPPESNDLSLRLNLIGGEVPLRMILLDQQGKILASDSGDRYPTSAALAQIEPPEVYAYAARALAGITETQQLAGWVSFPDLRLAAAAPVFNDQGQPIGAILTRSDAIPLAEFLGGLGISLLLPLVPVLVISSLVGLLYGWFAGRGFSRRLGQLARANAALAAGDLMARVDDQSTDEIGQLGRQFNSMAEQLAANLRELRQLAEQNAQLAERSGQLAIVEERNRLARDLHDSVSQELFSLSMLAAAARRVIDRRPAMAAHQLDEIQATAQRALQETRSLILALRPAALGDRGLAPALRDLAATAQDRQGITIDLRIAGERRLPLDHEQTLFRIAQEALANVARHSGVQSAQVALEYSDDRVDLLVCDAGCGFDLAAHRSQRSIGLQSMAERAAALGGQVLVESSPGHGTRVKVALPVLDEVKRQGHGL